MCQWDSIMGKRLRLYHYYVVTQIQSTGKYQDLEHPVIMREFLNRKFTDNYIILDGIDGIQEYIDLDANNIARVEPEKEPSNTIIIIYINQCLCNVCICV